MLYFSLHRPDGYLFDKESILEYVIRKKNEISRKMKEYEKQKKKEEVRLSLIHNLIFFVIVNDNE